MNLHLFSDRPAPDMDIQSKLPSHPLFQQGQWNETSAGTSYQRAKLLLTAYNITAATLQSDVWALVSDPLCAIDPLMRLVLIEHIRAMAALPESANPLSHMNLGLFLQREINTTTVETTCTTVETTCTISPTGYVLHTPNEDAAKFVRSGASLSAQTSRTAVVSAKLINDGVDRGNHSFVVPMCSETQLSASITVNPRTSSISFHHLQIPATAIVSSGSLSPPTLLTQPWSLLASAIPWVSALEIATHIAAEYASSHSILGKKNRLVPLFTVASHQMPIARSVAVALVLSNWLPIVMEQVTDTSVALRNRHSLAVIATATILRHFQALAADLYERCGVQATSTNNYLARAQAEIGIAIADADVSTLCTDLFSDMLIEGTTIPLPPPESSLLARHVSSLLEENNRLMRVLSCNHRNNSFDAVILQQSQHIVEAMGHALAYSTAAATTLPQCVLDLYECTVMRNDVAWYAESAGISRMDQRVKEAEAVGTVASELKTYLRGFGVEKYVGLLQNLPTKVGEKAML